MKLLKYSVYALSLALTFSACKKDEADDTSGDTSTDPTSGTLTLHLHHNYDGAAMAYNTNYTDDSGNVFYFTQARFYLSKTEAFNHDGDVIHTFDDYTVVEPGVDEIELGDISHTHIHELKVNIGVDSANNHGDPTTYPTTSALSPQTPSMFWSWNPGYKFIVFEGMVDTDSDSTPDASFVYHVGTDALYRKSEHIESHADVTFGSETEISIDINYAQFLEGIDIASDLDTHTMNNLPLATTIADNTVTAFEAQ